MATIFCADDEPVLYPAVHGGGGPPQRWTCFGRREETRIELEGFERAVLPVGTTIAEHTHSRSEEIYLVSRGKGVISLDGRRTPVGPGDLVLLPRTHSHGLENRGPEELELVIVELLPASIARRLPGRNPLASVGDS